MDEKPFWRRKTLARMTKGEWESLCDGCGRCCLNKLQEEGSDRTYYTDVGCRLLDGQSCRCTDYTNRSAKVKECVTLTSRNISRISWLPPTCGYKLVAEARICTGGTRSFRATRTACMRRGCRCGARWARARSTCRTRIWRIIS